MSLDEDNFTILDQQFPVKRSRQANRRFRKIFQFIFRKEYDLGQ
jgi:hypothetical protein